MIIIAAFIPFGRYKKRPGKRRRRKSESRKAGKAIENNKWRNNWKNSWESGTKLDCSNTFECWEEDNASRSLCHGIQTPGLVNYSATSFFRFQEATVRKHLEKEAPFFFSCLKKIRHFSLFKIPLPKRRLSVH